MIHAAVAVGVVRAMVAGSSEEVDRDESRVKPGPGDTSSMARAAHQNDDRLHCQEALSDREEPRVYERLCGCSTQS